MAFSKPGENCLLFEQLAQELAVSILLLYKRPIDSLKTSCRGSTTIGHILYALEKKDNFTSYSRTATTPFWSYTVEKSFNWHDFASNNKPGAVTTRHAGYGSTDTEALLLKH